MNAAALGSWAGIFRSESLKQQWEWIETQLQEESQQYRVFPDGPNRYKALELCPLEITQVVIVGQDPYPKEGQAHGLAFSVPTGMALPPSLINIRNEILQDPDADPAFDANMGSFDEGNGNLESWAQQGVLLLNTALSVRENQAGSHRHLPWPLITQAWIQLVSEQAKPSVFLLWGNHARALAPSIHERHLVLESAHPSPLSAYRGFVGSKPFGKANTWLRAQGRPGVDWMSPFRRSKAEL
jgi:uracil-DNA glycosylase